MHRVLTKILQAEKDESSWQKMISSMGELIYNQEKQVSTKRVARIVTYLSLLFTSTSKLKTSAKFLPGMLYAVGGLLKVETRNYLETKKSLDASFETAGPCREENPDAER